MALKSLKWIFKMWPTTSWKYTKEAIKIPMQSIGSFDYYLAFKTKNKTRMKLLKGLDPLFKTLKSSFCVQFFRIKPCQNTDRSTQNYKWKQQTWTFHGINNHSDFNRDQHTPLISISSIMTLFEYPHNLGDFLGRCFLALVFPFLVRWLASF